MNLKNPLLLALASVAVFAAAPAPAQESDNTYALEIQCTQDEIFVGNGVAGFPVALMFGFDEVRVRLPGNAVLRVNPLVIAVAGVFDGAGQFSLPLRFEPGELVGGTDFLMQALSVPNDWSKLSMSQLVQIHFEQLGKWSYIYRG